MSNYDNQTQKELEVLRDRSAEWIKNADNKTIGLLGIVGVLLAITSGPIFSSDIFVKPSCFEIVSLVAFLVSSAGSILISLLILCPRIEREEYLTTGDEAETLDYSPTFFGDVPESWCKFRNVRFDDEGESRMKKDLAEQAYIVSRIAKTKMCWLRKLPYMLGVSLLSLVALLGLRLI